MSIAKPTTPVRTSKLSVTKTKAWPEFRLRSLRMEKSLRAIRWKPPWPGTIRSGFRFRLSTLSTSTPTPATSIRKRFAIEPPSVQTQKQGLINQEPRQTPRLQAKVARPPKIGPTAADWISRPQAEILGGALTPHFTLLPPAQIEFSRRAAIRTGRQ